MNLVPMKGFLLVELGTSYENINIATRAYEGKSNGLVIGVAEADSSKHGWLENQHVFWDSMMEGSKVSREGKEYAFIRINQIQGYESAE